MNPTLLAIANRKGIIVTGLNEQGLEHRMLASGASEFFRKPIGFSQLIDAIDRYGHDAGSKL